jgi:hypothetical protein
MDGREPTEKLYLKSLFYGWIEATEERVINFGRFMMRRIQGFKSEKDRLAHIQTRVRGARLVLVENGANIKDVVLYRE